jgi:hypothetical protein
MPERLAPLEIKLRKFSERLHRGWAKLHPVTEQQLDVVRQAVRQKWAQEQRPAQDVAREGASPQAHKDRPTVKETKGQVRAPKTRTQARSAPRRRRVQKQTPKQAHRLSQ